VIDIDAGPYARLLSDGSHALVADEPNAVGGSGLGPDPYNLLLMSLGACTSMTLRLYAGRKRWPLEHVAVELSHSRVHAEDGAACETKAVMIDCIERHIRLEGPLDTDNASA
jgi:putative redox protein